MDDPERFAGLLAVLEELAADNAEIPIVVEGQRDVASLRSLGCRGEIHVLHAGLPLMALAERLARDQTRVVILLTDWDRKGGILYEQFSTTLLINSIRLHGQYRDRLAAWLAPGLQDVETLSTYVDKHLARLHGKALEEHVAEMEG